MAKFSLEDHDKRMSEIREKTRTPQQPVIEQLKEAARRRVGGNRTR